MQESDRTDLQALCKLWTTARSARMYLSATQVQLLKRWEAKALWQAELDLPQNPDAECDLVERRRRVANALERIVRENADSSALEGSHLPAWQSVLAAVPEPCLHVRVAALTGEVLELRLHDGATVAELKQAVLSKWKLPAACQQILQDGCLQDSHRLKSLKTSRQPLTDERSLELTLVISVEAVLRELQSPSARRRLHALKALSALGRRGGRPAVVAVVCRLNDPDELVRAAALEFLDASRHDDIASTAVRRCLYEGDAALRANALRALSELGADAGEQVASDIAACFSDPDGEVRACAVSALTRLPGRRDSNTAAAVHACLVDGDCRVRRAALRALGELQQPSAPLLAMIARLGDAEPTVRSMAVQVISQQAPRGDARAIAAVEALLVHVDAGVRVAAVQVLPQLSEGGDPAVTRALSHCLKDPDANVRAGSMMILSQLSGRGDKAAAAVCEAFPLAGWF